MLFVSGHNVSLFVTASLIIFAGDPEEPTTLISMLLLLMHVWQLYSLALTRFLLHSGGFPLQMYGVQRM